MNDFSDSYFQDRLQFGQKWELAVSQWLQDNKHYVLNVYEYTPVVDGVKKSPQLHITPSEQSLIAPDLQIAKDGITHWVEVKSKKQCGYPFGHRGNFRYRTTGIDIPYWDNYLKTQEVTGIKVIIFFVHIEEREVRAASLQELDNHHRKFINNNSNMVYWCYDDLQLIAEISEDDEIIGV
jgi:hypothetical protein